MTQAAQLAQYGANNVGLSFKNRIINGDMGIDQRNAGASVTPTNGVYTLDRWQIEASQTSKFSVQQNAGSVTPPVGFSNYLGVTSLSAYTVGASENFIIRQPLEGFNTADFGFGTASASTVTLSFWVRSSLTGTFGGSLKNDNLTRSYPFSYTISSANTWEYETITITGDTTGTWPAAVNTRSMTLSFGLGVGSTLSGTAGAWASANYASATGATSVVGTNGATFYITGVQLEKGTVATSFDYLPYGTELQLCQRYYQKFANSAGTTNAISNGFVWISTAYMSIIPFVTNMRTAPTGTTSSATGVTLLVNGTAKQSTSIVLSNSSTNAIQLEAVSSGMTAGQAGWLNLTSSTDFVALSAEL